MKVVEEEENAERMRNRGQDEAEREEFMEEKNDEWEEWWKTTGKKEASARKDMKAMSNTVRRGERGRKFVTRHQRGRGFGRGGENSDDTWKHFVIIP